ncbi:MAG: phenylacetate--CoA ligase family protein [Thermoleophilia bacterium]|nr:phenylacetate--CoA ligase family protein [Thermoleophilia bacterium]
MSQRGQRDALWSSLLRHAVLPAGDRVFSQRMMRRLRFLEEAQWWPREHVLELRDQRLRALVEVAYREVPFYRDLMRGRSLRPQHIAGAADLSKLPVVTKAMLRAAYPERVTRPTGRRTYEASTSGSTGTNFRVREDHETFGWYLASFMLALEWAGWRMGEPQVQTGMNPERSLSRRLKDAALRCHYVSARDLRDGHLDSVLDLIQRKGIRHLWGYPGSLYYLACRAEARGWDTPLRTAITWGDMLHPQYRSTIERVFGARVNDTYGCGEGIQIAAQCDVADGYHVHSLDVVVEYLDEAGEPVPVGESGDVVVTRLHPGPMPLIRYQVGDAAVGGGDRSCPCGRSFEMMERIEGRNADVVETPSGNRLIVHFFTGILEYFPQIDTFQVVQNRPGAVVVRIVPAAGYDDEVGRAVATRLREAGADLEIAIELVPEIPPTPGGKRRFVISELDGEAR